MRHLPAAFLVLLLIAAPAIAQHRTLWTPRAQVENPALLPSLQLAAPVPPRVDTSSPLSEWLLQSWIGAGWENDFRALYSYSTDVLAEDLRQDWYRKAWVNYERVLPSYNDNGTLATELVEAWSGVEWEPSSRTSYTYDGDMLSAQLVQDWDGTEWVSYRLYTFAYDDGNLADILAHIWTSDGWELIYRERNSYDGGYLVEWVSQLWKGEGWANYTQRLYTNDSDGNPTVILRQDWIESAWRDGARTLNTWDDSGRLDRSVLQHWSGSEWADFYRGLYAHDGEDITEIVEQTWDGTAWRNFYRQLYSYSTTTATEEEAPSQTTSLAVFPNPLRSEAVVAFDLAQGGTIGFEVYDVVGRRVTVLPEQAFGAGEQRVRWDLRGLPVGVYVLRMRGAVTATRRFVVVR